MTEREHTDAEARWRRQQELERQIAAKEGTRGNDMLMGALWFFGGLILTTVTYSHASSGGGGTYLIAWGPMAYGAIRFLRGLAGGR